MCESKSEYLIITWVRVQVLVDEYEYKYKYWSIKNFCQMWRNGSAVGVCVEAEYDNFIPCVMEERVGCRGVCGGRVHN